MIILLPKEKTHSKSRDTVTQTSIASCDDLPQYLILFEVSFERMSVQYVSEETGIPH
jgi:hypothetical protein